MAAPSPDMPAHELPTVYLEAINDLVKDEQARKASLEERGIRVITTSGALATLLFAVAKFGQGNENLGTPDETYLVLAVVFFVAAAVLGLFANQVQRYFILKPAALQDYLTNPPSDAGATVIVARDKVEWYLTARVINGRKALCLFAAVTLEVVAIMCVAAAVAIVLGHHILAVVVLAASLTSVVFLLLVRGSGPNLWDWYRSSRKEHKELADGASGARRANS